MRNNMKRDRVMYRMQNDLALLEVYKTEKQNMDLIIDQALNYPSGANRWTAYEALKRQANLIVGWDAAPSPIATAQHYELLTEFIDYLLPQPISEDETPRDSLYIDEDTLIAWHAHAAQVLTTIQEQRLLAAPKSKELAIINNFIDSSIQEFSVDETEN